MCFQTQTIIEHAERAAYHLHAASVPGQKRKNRAGLTAPGSKADQIS